MLAGYMCEWLVDHTSYTGDEDHFRRELQMHIFHLIVPLMRERHCIEISGGGDRVQLEVCVYRTAKVGCACHVHV
jgi:hypothetical protein